MITPPEPLMTAGDRLLEAERRAAAYAPPPAYDPAHAGIACAGAAGMVIAAFSGLAGVGTSAAGPAVVVAAAAYLIPWWLLKKQNDRYLSAVAREFSRTKTGPQINTESC